MRPLLIVVTLLLLVLVAAAATTDNQALPGGLQAALQSGQTHILISKNVTLSALLEISSSTTIEGAVPGVFINCDGNPAAMHISDGVVALVNLHITGCKGNGTVIKVDGGASLAMSNVHVSNHEADTVVSFKGTPSSSLNTTGCSFTGCKARAVLVAAHATGVVIPDTRNNSAFGVKLGSTADFFLNPTQGIGVDRTGLMTMLALSGTEITSNTVSQAVLSVTGAYASLHGVAIGGNTAAAGANDTAVILAATAGVDLLHSQLTGNSVSGALINFTMGVSTLSLRGSLVNGNNATAILSGMGFTWYLKYEAYVDARYYVDHDIYGQWPNSTAEQLKQFAKRAAMWTQRDQSKGDSRVLLQGTNMTNNHVTLAIITLDGTDSPGDGWTTRDVTENSTAFVVLQSRLDANVIASQQQDTGVLHGQHYNGAFVNSSISSNRGQRVFSTSSCGLHINGTAFDGNVNANRLIDVWYGLITMDAGSVFSNNVVKANMMINMTSVLTFMADTSFINNTASDPTQPIVAIYDSTAYFQHLSFRNNTGSAALSLQAGTCPAPVCNGKGVAVGKAEEVQFAANNGMGLEIAAISQLATLDPGPTLRHLSFMDNKLSANQTGALCLRNTTVASGTSTIVVEDSIFHGNAGTNAGGAIFADAQINKVGTVLVLVVNGSNFMGNVAKMGAAISAGTTLHVVNSSFVNNRASQAGGAVAWGMPTGNGANAHADFSGCTFTENAATGLHAENDTALPTPAEATVSFPYGAGGAVAIDATQAVVTFEQCAFQNNDGRLGGAAFWYAGNTCPSSGTTTGPTIGPGSSNSSSGSSSIGSNSSSSTVSAAAVSCSITLHNCDVSGNTAHDGGGTLFGWDGSDVLQVCCDRDPAQTTSCSTATSTQVCPTWSRTEPADGTTTYDTNGYATPPVYMIMRSLTGNSTAQEVISGSAINVTIELQDYYHKRVVGYASALDFNLDDLEQDLFVIGNKTRQAQSGFVHWDSMLIQPVISPSNKTYTLWMRGVNTTMNPLPLSLIIPHCTIGQNEDLYRCIECNKGSYSLNSTVQCEPCPTGGYCPYCPLEHNCNQGSLLPTPGYWQPSPLMPQMLMCPLPSSCNPPDRLDRLQTLLQLLPPVTLLLDHEQAHDYIARADPGLYSILVATGGLKPGNDNHDADAATHADVAASPEPHQHRRRQLLHSVTIGQDTLNTSKPLSVYSMVFQRQMCSPGYEGILCGCCQPGYGRFSTQCVQCVNVVLNSFMYAGVVLMMAVIISFTVLTHVKSKEKEARRELQLQAANARAGGYWMDDSSSVASAQLSQSLVTKSWPYAMSGILPAVSETTTPVSPPAEAEAKAAAAERGGRAAGKSRSGDVTAPQGRDVSNEGDVDDARAPLMTRMPSSAAAGSRSRALSGLTQATSFHTAPSGGTAGSSLVSTDDEGPEAAPDDVSDSDTEQRDAIRSGGGGTIARRKANTAGATPAVPLSQVADLAAVAPKLSPNAAARSRGGTPEELQLLPKRDSPSPRAPVAAGGNAGAKSKLTRWDSNTASGRRFNKLAHLSSMVKILVSFVQVTAIARNLNIQWPITLATLFSHLDYSSTSSWISLDCSFTGTSEYRAVMATVLTCSMPVMLMVGAFPVWLVLWANKRRNHAGLPQELSPSNYFKPRLITTLVQIAYYTYTLVTATLLEIFECTTLEGPSAGAQLAYADAAYAIMGTPGGEATPWSAVWLTGRFWDRNFNTRCFESPLHRRLALGLGLPGLLLFGAGVPLTFLLLLWRHRMQLGDPRVQLKYGFLYQEYRSGLYYWESAIMARKAIVVLVSALLAGTATAGPSLVVYTTAIIMVCFFLLHEIKLPFRTKVLNNMERVSLFTNIITFILLSYLLIDPDLLEPGSGLAVTLILYAVNVAALCYLLTHIIWIGWDIAHTVLDVDKDGKVTWRDLRRLASIARHKSGALLSRRRRRKAPKESRDGPPAELRSGAVASPFARVSVQGDEQAGGPHLV